MGKGNAISWGEEGGGEEAEEGVQSTVVQLSEISNASHGVYCSSLTSYLPLTLSHCLSLPHYHDITIFHLFLITIGCTCLTIYHYEL